MCHFKMKFQIGWFGRIGIFSSFGGKEEGKDVENKVMDFFFLFKMKFQIGWFCRIGISSWFGEKEWWIFFSFFRNLSCIILKWNSKLVDLVD